MPNTIAEYFADELLDWSHAITFYDEEMKELENKLGEVLRRNSIVGIAGRVEAHQKLLNTVSDKFSTLQIEFKQQENLLKTDSTFVDNSFINNETANRQNELRENMQKTEKEYVDVKFGCYNFLSGTLKR